MATRKTKKGSGESELVFGALGGLGEIGMNAYLYGVGPRKSRKWLLVDLGITFPEGENDPGVDVIFPDLRFLEEERNALCGIVITHAHEDHIGAVLELWPRLQVPVFCTPFATGMLKAKRAGYGGSDELEITEVPADGQFNVGPFDVELVTMAHSIPETSALAIRTEHGLVVHTSDWKLDDEPVVGSSRTRQRMPELGAEGVTALICDSTNAMRDGVSPSELDIAKSLSQIIEGASNRVIVTTFASNIARVKAVGTAARRANRKLVIAGLALHRNIQVAIETGYLPEGFSYSDQQSFSDFRRSDVVCLVTGSQGEQRAALARIAAGEHRDIQVAKGDMVIFSSRTIPGNEREVGRIQNALVSQGCEVVTDNEALVHVTGHPRRDELRQMYDWVKPDLLVPMHGEARHLNANAALARECNIKDVRSPHNGTLIRLAPGPSKVVDEFPVGRLFRDGKLIIPEDDGTVRARRQLAMAGIIMVSFAIEADGEVITDPQIVLDGVPSEDNDGAALNDLALEAVEGVIASLPKSKRRDPARFGEAVRRAVRSEIRTVWGKKPIVKVIINLVEDED